MYVCVSVLAIGKFLHNQETLWKEKGDNAKIKFDQSFESGNHKLKLECYIGWGLLGHSPATT